MHTLIAATTEPDSANQVCTQSAIRTRFNRFHIDVQSRQNLDVWRFTGEREPVHLGDAPGAVRLSLPLDLPPRRSRYA